MHEARRNCFHRSEILFTVLKIEFLDLCTERLYSTLHQKTFNAKKSVVLPSVIIFMHYSINQCMWSGRIATAHLEKKILLCGYTY